MAEPSGKPIGETNLSTLLSTLQPLLADETYVFATIPHPSAPGNPSAPALPIPLSDILLLFREQEGLTLITSLETACSQGLTYTYECRMITCHVHSSLEAVGMMAHIATKLAESGVSVNPVSGYFHDHLFVPVGKEGLAMEVLASIGEDAKKSG